MQILLNSNKSLTKLFIFSNLKNKTAQIKKLKKDFLVSFFIYFIFFLWDKNILNIKLGK